MLSIAGEDDAQGYVILFHGLAANKKIMSFIARGFALQGLRVFVPDLPGHGRTPGPFSFERAEACGDSFVKQMIGRGAVDAKPDDPGRAFDGRGDRGEGGGASAGGGSDCDFAGADGHDVWDSGVRCCFSTIRRRRQRIRWRSPAHLNRRAYAATAQDLARGATGWSRQVRAGAAIDSCERAVRRTCGASSQRMVGAIAGI